MNVVELFSGIGSQIKALRNVSKKYNFSVRGINTCEWDIHAIIAYDLIHNGNGILSEVQTLSKELILKKLEPLNLSADGKNRISPKTLHGMNDILLKSLLSSILRTNNLVNIRDVHGRDFHENFDLLTYSFPCQDLSNVGAFHGYKNGIDRGANTRSGLLWEVERILIERSKEGLSMPRYLLLENVAAINSVRHRKNFEDWQNSLQRMGYTNKFFEMYAPTFGIPQNRNRLLMLSVFNGHNINFDQEIRKTLDQWDFHNNQFFGYREAILSDFLKLDYSNPVFLSEAMECQPNATDSRKKIWMENPKIVNENGVISEKISTLTTKQDRHPNSGNLYFDPRNGKSRYRFLSPRECFLLMGFQESEYEEIVNSNLRSCRNSHFFSRDKLYRLTGNSIVVNVLEAIFEIIAVIEINLFSVPSKIKSKE